MSETTLLAPRVAVALPPSSDNPSPLPWPVAFWLTVVLSLLGWTGTFYGIAALWRAVGASGGVA
jgi:hypothetical protein